jgi:hypothetical protein
MNANNPLLPAEQHRQTAEQALQMVPHIRDFLNRCESCGLPIEDRKQDLEQAADFLQRFLHNFYPNP